MEKNRFTLAGKLTIAGLVTVVCFLFFILGQPLAEDRSSSAVDEFNSIFQDANKVEWNYLDDGSNQGSDWASIDYDDSSWKTGLAPLGYGRDNKGLNTVTGFGNDSGKKHITTYFRKEFELKGADAFKQLKATLVRDDGAVIYVNGQEVFRSNMPQESTISYDTLAANTVNDERNEYEFDIDPSILVDGKNVVAVEVHQINQTSSDTFFSLALEGSTIEPGKNNGLLAEYFTNSGDNNFDKVDWKSTAVEPNVDFGNLDPVLQKHTGRADDASIDFTGQLVPEFTEEYTFSMIGDNGFRLWIDDQLVIDHWVNDWDVEQTSSPIQLEAGREYDIKMEYFEDHGGSNLHLSWSSPSVEKEIVPEEALFLPSGYNGPISGTVLGNGQTIEVEFVKPLAAIPSNFPDHLTVNAGDQQNAVENVELDKTDSSILHVKLEDPIAPNQHVTIAYDGKDSVENSDGEVINGFQFTPENYSEWEDYSPIAIAMSLYGDAKTQRSFAWYTNHEHPENAPDNVLDSIVEVVPAGSGFDSKEVLRFTGDSQVLDLKVTNSQNGTFSSHKVLVEGLEPGTSYEYRLGSEGNWSEIGEFITEAKDESEFEFLYMTDSQGANTHDYEVWADTLGQGLQFFPDSKFLIMGGDQVDAGAMEHQWLDYFAKPQELLMDLPVMAAVGNHEGPYHNNFHYHFHYPNDAIDNPLPPGSVYSFDYGDAHFMVLNTMDMGWDDRQRESFNQQIEWLKHEVAKTDKKWKIVSIHKAIYSVGGHSADEDIFELREMLYPVFDELGIDVVLQGHDHTFMRSHQMYNDKPVTDIEADENGNVINPDGTMYIVNNAAGTKYYDVREDVDKYYAAKYEQPYKPVFSGVKMTENSLTIDSYRSGEKESFDHYTIVRNDKTPEPVDGLTAVRNGNGQIVLNWKKPEEAKKDSDPVRGFRIYEKEGRLGKNWSAYVPVEEDQKSYQYTVKDAENGKNYQFVVKAVDKRDNSEGTVVSTKDIPPAAPTKPVTDDGYNTFGWTNVPGYEKLSAYEYSVDNGETWKTVTANPQPVGNRDIPKGHVQVRIKASAEMNNQAGMILKAPNAYTKNQVNETFELNGTIKHDDKLVVDIEIDKQAEYSKDAYLVIELFAGNTPLLINAIPLEEEQTEISQYFNVHGKNYKVKAFVFDRFNSDLDLPQSLAGPIVLK
ncbi:hypothetical protein GCM10011409_18250 [Lentibacillus populi]|uniref:PA14 domain-containing protein n=1 Tax=Lentibacillus populi TaxID=1827502 RepID=A0A9W5TX67_9BACI|nr:PA14 domain-containing protein [Lentibacillus populi]MBT2214531.1 metallophosphoesterase [Virgibacillus dakarensis]GGB41084.1 hypothetical protein GCM10011409_18250 [Lentibacillus populi]